MVQLILMYGMLQYAQKKSEHPKKKSENSDHY
jgi:hypothetical protein